MKNLKNLGKALNKAEQKEISAGRAPNCNPPLVACVVDRVWSCKLSC